MGRVKPLKDKLIAVVGVSGDMLKFGHRIFKSLVGEDFNVYGVNPKGGNILNRKVYKSLSEMENAPDIVITVVKPEITEKIIEECRALGINEIWMQPGSESQKAVELAKKYGMSVTYGACIMVSNGIW
jgi:uncharacterized protein